jgi:demethylmenaquinone methyltransferase/2-methoxy-6-polyprenyl-1,4-benzoquinol methylase
MQRQSLENGIDNNIRHLFSSIARHYDITNRWMTWGQDARWRHEVLDKANLPIGGKLLDVGAGTGDLSLEALTRDKSAIVVGVDFTAEMMQLGRKRKNGDSVCWINCDALDLPLPCGMFDAVISGYLLRNVPNVQRALSEQYRVLKRGGRVVCLDTCPPSGGLRHLPVRLYLRYILPFVGGLVAGNAEAYRYLARSTESFLKADELARCLQQAGFKEVNYRKFMGGVMAIHWGVK